MRVLVLTNQFALFGGSEIVALEVAHWFREQGDEVTLAANYINAPISAQTEGLTLTIVVAQLDLRKFDLVWCQHDLLTLIPPAEFERLAEEWLPYTVVVSLSPFELFEHVDGWLAEALSAEVFANSDETRAEQARRSHGDLSTSRIHVFHNAAPSVFWGGAVGDLPTELRTLTLISNHSPPELTQALQSLEQRGVSVRRIGFGHEWRLVSPEDIRQTDAVVTIGKSVPYAIANSKPVYVYDQFGGDGWLTKENFEQNLAHNFSGRPRQRRVSADDIARELVEGFSAAASAARQWWEVIDLRLFLLDDHLQGVRDRAAQGSPAARALHLRRHMEQYRFRAHLETLHAKSTIMRRSFIASQPSG